MKIDRTVVDAVRARHEAARPKAGVNPAWANAEHDIGLLLEYIDSFEKINVEPYESPAFRELRKMRTLLSMHSPLQQNLPRPIPVTETLFKEIEALQRSDAAWRNAHNVNMTRAQDAEKRATAYELELLKLRRENVELKRIRDDQHLGALDDGAKINQLQEDISDLQSRSRDEKQRYIDHLIRQRDLYKLLRLAHFELMMSNDAKGKTDG